MADEQKFNDLLVIAQNIAGTEYAPKMVRDFNIPTPLIASKPVIPTLFAPAPDAFVIGAKYDHSAAASAARTRVLQALGAYEAMLQLDIDAAGGLEKLVLTERNGQLVPRSQSEIKAALRRGFGLREAA